MPQNAVSYAKIWFSFAINTSTLIEFNGQWATQVWANDCVSFDRFSITSPAPVSVYLNWIVRAECIACRNFQLFRFGVVAAFFSLASFAHSKTFVYLFVVCIECIPYAADVYARDRIWSRQCAHSVWLIHFMRQRHQYGNSSTTIT